MADRQLPAKGPGQVPTTPAERMRDLEAVREQLEARGIWRRLGRLPVRRHSEVEQEPASQHMLESAFKRMRRTLGLPVGESLPEGGWWNARRIAADAMLILTAGDNGADFDQPEADYCLLSVYQRGQDNTSTMAEDLQIFHFPDEHYSVWHSPMRPVAGSWDSYVRDLDSGRLARLSPAEPKHTPAEVDELIIAGLRELSSEELQARLEAMFAKAAQDMAEYGPPKEIILEGELARLMIQLHRWD